MTATNGSSLEPCLGLARFRDDDGQVRVVWRRSGSPQAWLARVDGREFDDIPALLIAADGDPTRIERGGETSAPDEALLSCVGRPRKILCVGLNYITHVREAQDAGLPAEIPPHPDLFPKWDTALAGPYAEIALPPESIQIDYESELAVVIGSQCRRVPAESAQQVIFGYTAANDGSVRDYQLLASQVLPGKAWDGLTPLGPVIVPAAQLGGATPDLAITGLFDGAVVQDDRTSSLIKGVPELIAFISTFMTLEPGDVILTGTTSGVGIVRKPPLWLKDGSVFEVRIEGIGSLRNVFRKERAPGRS